MPDGRFVEVYPDSLPEDSLKKIRPEYKSDAGRTVYGGGAITPDLVVQPDTLTTPEQELAKALTSKFTEAYQVVSAFAYDQKGKVQRDFAITPAWRDEIYRRLQAADVVVDRATYDRGAGYIDYLLEQRVAQTSFGEAAVRERMLRTDPQFQAALEALRRASSQRELFAIASARAGS